MKENSLFVLNHLQEISRAMMAYLKKLYESKEEEGYKRLSKI